MSALSEMRDIGSKAGAKAMKERILKMVRNRQAKGREDAQRAMSPAMRDAFDYIADNMQTLAGEIERLEL
jgi:hypothetical protein